MSRPVREKEVDFLESQSGCFRIEEVDDLHISVLHPFALDMRRSSHRNKDKIQTHENEIALPGEVLDESRRDHHHEEIPEPVCGYADCLSLRGLLACTDNRRDGTA